jgi:nicotinate-nucleotide pyrophosphorylase (carboxylating)
MRPPYITQAYLDHFITTALAEDIGDGDHSTLAAIPSESIKKAKLLVKDDGILAGVELAAEIFHAFDPSLKLEMQLSDSASIKKGDVVFTVEGSARSILSTERLVLNCMQRMSAIATKMHYLNTLVRGIPVKLLDTRKTTPNFRLIEKWAVVLGGGYNHRIGLFDMIMLKDNHIDMAGGIEQAIIRTKDYLRARNKSLKIEIETRSVKEVEEVMRIGGVDIIMLDNMDLKTMKRAVEIVAGRYKTEASGGVTEETIRDIAQCGVDFISVGALTHSIKSLDLSLKAY